VSYHAVPRIYKAEELGLKQKDPCALCGSREIDPSITRDWVRCPLVDDAPICLRCCFDYQAVARSEDFDSHPFRGLFDYLSKRIRRSVPYLRMTCLQHQQETVAENLPNATSESDEAGLIGLAGRVAQAIRTLEAQREQGDDKPRTKRA